MGRSLLAPIADWRVQLVWRLYGWAGVQQALLFGSNRSPGGWLADVSPWVHAQTVCALLLIAFGARPLLFFPTAVVSSGILIVTALGEDPKLDFPGAELPLFAILPVGGAVLWGLAPRSPELAPAILWLFRITFLVEMGFAALHKLNRDFFVEALSCATILSRTLPEWWSSPLASLADYLTPPVVVATEAAIPLLAVVLWPAGLLLMLAFLSGLAVTGPTGFTAITIAAGFSFVRGTTREAFYRLPRRWPWAFAVLGSAIILHARAAYRGPAIYPWPQYVLYLSVVAFLAACILGAVADRFRRGSREDPGAAIETRERGFALPATARLRVALAVILVVGILDGMTPYLGWKYEFSFAMLSNLRTDRLRWNSLVVPPAVRLLDLDPYVEVKKLRIRRAGGSRTDPDRELVEALFPPYELVRRVDYHRRHRHRLDLWLVYGGREYFFPRVEQNEEAAAFLAALPRTLLYPQALVRGPQPCVH